MDWSSGGRSNNRIGAVEEDQIKGLEKWSKINNRIRAVEENQITELELWWLIIEQDWSSGGRSNNRIGAVDEDEIT